jgi:actinin alpha
VISISTAWPAQVLGVLREEGVPLVNIGAEDICDGNPKLLLGLLWLLILRYHIAQG